MGLHDVFCLIPMLDSSFPGYRGKQAPAHTVQDIRLP